MKRIVLGACLASAVVFLVSASRVSAQEGQGIYITQASARLTKLVDSGNKAGYGLQDNSFSIGGGWLKQGATNWVPLYTVQLTAGKKYRFVGSGDNDAKDVDLEVVEVDTKKTVASDTGADPEAVVDYTPANTGRYLVRIRVYDSRENLPCMCLGVVMVKN